MFDGYLDPTAEKQPPLLTPHAPSHEPSSASGLPNAETGAHQSSAAPRLHVDDDGKLSFRTIWISDIHLGTAGCQAELLLEFLRHTESKELYLVGDIIDGWQLRRRWYWQQSHNDVVQKVLRKARKGTKVTYVAGNHDEFARQFLGLAFGDIAIVNEAVHQTAAGKKLLIIHGDQFDAVVQCAKWLAYLGDWLYGIALEVNRILNRMRKFFGLRYWSLSQYLKHRVKNAVSYINAFEEAVAREAKRQGMDGVVCGHIHRPEIREIEGITYCNDGDWVESLSALVETHEGELRILTWLEVEAWHQAHSAPHAQVDSVENTVQPEAVPA